MKKALACSVMGIVVKGVVRFSIDRLEERVVIHTSNTAKLIQVLLHFCLLAST